MKKTLARKTSVGHPQKQIPHTARDIFTFIACRGRVPFMLHGKWDDKAEVILAQIADLEVERVNRDLALILRAGFVDFGLRFVELRLTEFDDRAKSQLVTRLSEIEGHSSLLLQALVDGELLIGCVGVEPGYAHVPNDLILQFAQILVSFLGLKMSLGVSRGEKSAIENGNAEIESGGGVAVDERRFVNGREAGYSDGAQGGHPKIAFSMLKCACGITLQLSGLDFRALTQSFGDKLSSVGSGRGRQRQIGKLIGLRSRVTEGERQVCIGGLDVVLRLGEEKLRLSEVHVRKTDIEAGLELIFRKLVDLIGDELAFLDGFLPDAKDRLRLQNAIIGFVHFEKNAGASGVGVLLRGLSAKARGLA